MKSRINTWLICGILLITGCSSKSEGILIDSSNELVQSGNVSIEAEENNNQLWMAINPLGETLETRFNVPENYDRVAVDEGSFAQFLRDYKLKPDGSDVLLYDGSKKFGKSVHAAVFALPIEVRDLQQCADSIMRIYGEYYYSIGEYSKIKFPMGGGFVGDYDKWSQGNRIKLSGDSLCWVSDNSCDASYESFVKFMHIVFAYSGTQNMAADSKNITIEEAKIGDIFIKGGSPGHVVMIVEMCENEKGEKAFLLAQGYMPAQEFHVLNNPKHKNDPWYYEKELTYPFRTAEYTFPENSLKTLNW